MGINGCQDEFSPPSECFITNYMAAMREQEEAVAPVLKAPVGRKTLKAKKTTILGRWQRGQSLGPWSNSSLPRATKLFLAQGHMREKGQDYISPQWRKDILYKYTRNRLIGEHQMITPENTCMGELSMASSHAPVIRCYASLYELFRWLYKS